MRPRSSTHTNPRPCPTGQCIAATMADIRAMRQWQDLWVGEIKEDMGPTGARPRGCSRIKAAVQGTRAAATTTLRVRITAIPTPGATATHVPAIRTTIPATSATRIQTMRTLTLATSTTHIPIRAMLRLVRHPNFGKCHSNSLTPPLSPSHAPRRSPSRALRLSNTTTVDKGNMASPKIINTEA